MNEYGSAISVDNITKIYGGRKNQQIKALKDVSFEVNRGEIFGLLGPNGAGKTTLVKVLLGALTANQGTAEIYGLSINSSEARAIAGFLPENHFFPQYQTGRQMISYFGGLAGMSRSEIDSKINGLLEMVGMSKWIDTTIKKYSKGMKQRLGLAQALINDPQIVFLDEPTDGVDPVGRREIRDILRKLKEQGKTVFLNSHLLAEVESVCDRVAILNKGEVIKTGPAVGLTDSRPAYNIQTVKLSDKIKSRVGENYENAKITETDISLTLENDIDINSMIDLLRSNGIDIISVMPLKSSLEDSFMQLIEGAENNE